MKDDVLWLSTPTMTKAVKIEFRFKKLLGTGFPRIDVTLRTHTINNDISRICQFLLRVCNIFVDEFNIICYFIIYKISSLAPLSLLANINPSILIGCCSQE